MRRFGETTSNPLRKIRARILLGSFTGDPNDIYRAVHFLKDNNFFFSDYGRDFFNRIYHLVLEKKIKEVRRLFVYEEQQEIESEQSQRLLRFHAQTTGYRYKLIPIKAYEDLERQFGMHPAIDFGIFGTKRVYRARMDRPDMVIGTWSSKHAEVVKYAQFFDTCWLSQLAFELKDLISERSITVDELFV